MNKLICVIKGAHREEKPFVITQIGYSHTFKIEAIVQDKGSKEFWQKKLLRPQKKEIKNLYRKKSWFLEMFFSL